MPASAARQGVLQAAAHRDLRRSMAAVAAPCSRGVHLHVLFYDADALTWLDGRWRVAAAEGALICEPLLCACSVRGCCLRRGRALAVFGLSSVLGSRTGRIDSYARVITAPAVEFSTIRGPRFLIRSACAASVLPLAHAGFRGRDAILLDSKRNELVDGVAVGLVNPRNGK